MKVVAILWRDHTGSIKPEKFAADDFTFKTDPGWLKIIGKTGVFRLIPADKVHVVEYVEEEEKSQIVSPHNVGPIPVPKNWQPS